MSARNPFLANADQLDVFIAGRPAPQGSKRHVGNGVMVESSTRLRPWRRAVEDACREAGATFVGPVSVGLVFVLARPKRPSWPVPAGPPDLDKMARAVLDALQDSGAIENDSRVVTFHELRKRWTERGEHAGLYLTVRSWPA